MALARQRRWTEANRDKVNADTSRRARARTAANPKTCARCGASFPRIKSGPRKFCSDLCQKTNARDLYLQKTYGITLADYRAILATQDNRCVLCRRKSQRTLAVEHSHITGTVRGLACMTCNRDVVGPLDGDLKKLGEAIAYLTLVRDDLAAHGVQPDG